MFDAHFPNGQARNKHPSRRRLDQAESLGWDFIWCGVQEMQDVRIEQNAVQRRVQPKNPSFPVLLRSFERVQRLVQKL